MSQWSKRNYSAEEKVSILKRHLLGHEAVSEVCQSCGISPYQFYRWQKSFFENGALAFSQRSNGESAKVRTLKDKVSSLESQVKRKDSVIAEITEDYVKLKKNSGEI